jgi:hypothetical protein
MYDFSRALILGHGDRSLPDEITHQIATLFGIEGVWFYSSSTDLIYRTETVKTFFKESDFRATANTGEVWRDVNHGAFQFSLEAIIQLIAIAIERARAQETATLLHATRQSELADEPSQRRNR